jgi:hypothetical protein
MLNPTSFFDFEIPRAYSWLLERGLVGYEAFSQLQPWHYLDNKSCFDLNERWPARKSGEQRLIAFAKRQDCDDLACFVVRGRSVEGVYLIHAWTTDGYDIVSKYSTFWEWLKSVVGDIEDWVGEA